MESELCDWPGKGAKPHLRRKGRFQLQGVPIFAHACCPLSISKLPKKSQVVDKKKKKNKNIIPGGDNNIFNLIP